MRIYNNLPTSDKEVKAAFQKMSKTKEGTVVLSFLCKITLDRFLGPDATDAQLRHLEGQRQLVSYILSQSYKN